MKKMMERLGAALMLATMIATAPAMAAADKPLVIESGKVKQLPAATTLQVNASGTGAASINIPHGTAPTSPANGDCWTTTAGLYCRINGATVGPYNAGAGSSITSKDEGSTLTSATTSIDFTGTGVTATNTGGAVTVNVPGGGASSFDFPRGIMNPNTGTSFSSGFVGMAPWIVPATGTLLGIRFYGWSAAATATIEPVVYSNSTATHAPASKLATGPTVTGAVLGVNTIPFSTGLSVTKGTVLWIGLNIQTAAVMMGTQNNPVSAHFAQASIPAPSTAPTTTISNQGWASMWAYN
jgi:hypothetical protein